MNKDPPPWLVCGMNIPKERHDLIRVFPSFVFAGPQIKQSANIRRLSSPGYWPKLSLDEIKSMA